MANLFGEISQEMIDFAKARHRKVNMVELLDSEQNIVGVSIVGTPSAFAIKEFERFIDKDPAKAKAVLINGCFPIEEHKNIIKGWDKNSDEYASAFDAAAQMLPVGRAVLKKL